MIQRIDRFIDHKISFSYSSNLDLENETELLIVIKVKLKPVVLSETWKRENKCVLSGSIMSAVSITTPRQSCNIFPFCLRVWAERFDHRLQQSFQQSVRRLFLSGQQLFRHRRKRTRQVLVSGRVQRAMGTATATNRIAFFSSWSLKG